MIQRVREASVVVGQRQVAGIGSGLVVLAGFHAEDDAEVVQRMAGDVLHMRVFDDGSDG